MSPEGFNTLGMNFIPININFDRLAEHVAENEMAHFALDWRSKTSGNFGPSCRFYPFFQLEASPGQYWYPGRNIYQLTDDNAGGVAIRLVYKGDE